MTRTVPRHFSLICSCFAVFALSAFFSACRNNESRTKIWIYSAAYQNVNNALDQKMKQRFPDLDIRWFQSGSENIAARVQAEILAGRPQADILMTADIFFFEELKNRRQLLSYEPNFAAAPRSLSDLDKGSGFRVSRFPVFVIAYNKTFIGDAQKKPESFADLVKPEFRKKLSMPSCLESGTAFAAVVMLKEKFGWDFFKALRKNEVLIAGGNHAVAQKLLSGERPVAMMLLENARILQKKNPSIEIVKPKEGVILVPSPVAALATTKNPSASRKILDFMLSEDAQMVFVETGDTHSIYRTFAPPQNTLSLSELEKTEFHWTRGLIERTALEKESIKERFSEVVFE